MTDIRCSLTSMKSEHQAAHQPSLPSTLGAEVDEALGREPMKNRELWRALCAKPKSRAAEKSCRAELPWYSRNRVYSFVKADHSN
jgi:hypothetical protein